MDTLKLVDRGSYANGVLFLFLFGESDHCFPLACT